MAIGEKDYNWWDIETEMLKTFTDDKNFNWLRVYHISINRSENFLGAIDLDYIMVGILFLKY